MVLPCNQQDVWYLSSIYDYPRITRERNLEISDRWIGVHQREDLVTLPSESVSHK